MVDVGFYLLGYDRTLKKVNNLGISEKQNCYIFKDGDGTEYLIPIESVEWIIPHEEECRAEEVCTHYTEEQMIALCQSVDKPLTNAEKFKEVFGFEPNIESLCDIMSDSDCGKYHNCNGCPIRGHCEWHNKWENPNDTN